MDLKHPSQLNTIYAKNIKWAKGGEFVKKWTINVSQTLPVKPIDQIDAIKCGVHYS